MALEQKHSHSIMGDKPYSYFKAYFWIGSRSKNHQSKVSKAIVQLEEALPSASARLRVYIEYQYTESLEFFTLFNTNKTASA